MSSLDPDRPRSTPIPGEGTPLTPHDFETGASQPAPPPGFGPTPATGFPGTTGYPGGGFPGAAPGSFPGAAMPLQGGFPGGPGFPGGAGFPGGPAIGMPGVMIAPPRRRSGVGCLFLALILIGPVIGVGVAIWAVVRASQATHSAAEASAEVLTAKSQKVLGVGSDVTSFFQPTAASALMKLFDTSIGGSPTKYTEVLLYGYYAFADVQAPSNPEHLDQYGFRTGVVSGPDPQSNDPQLTTKLFTSSDVNWEAIGTLTSQAGTLAGVEEGTVSHVIVERDSGTSTAVVVRVYVTGPRDSKYIEADAQGTVIAVH
jgi:hypothetical protein